LYQRALHIREQALGPEHPRVADPLNGLANLYLKQRKDAEAERLYQRALHIREQALGPDHSDVAVSLHGLANLYQMQGKDTEAESLYQRACSIREQHLGQYHPETAQTLHDLALFRQKQGNLSEALSLVERVLAIRSQSLGDAHPKTNAARTLYAQFLQAREDAEKEDVSEQCAEEILDQFRKEHQAERASPSLHEAVNPSPAENDPLQGFLNACCELHPRAWCRSVDLWQAYEHWGEEHQERFPLSRRAFTAQLKAHGYRADRTNAARIWRGIAVVDNAL
jgi:tetratricopeptide (TPR) repeat protein